MDIRRTIAALKQQGRLQRRPRKPTGEGENAGGDGGAAHYYYDDEDETEEDIEEAISSMVGSSASATAAAGAVDYEARIRAKLGSRKSKLMGYGGSGFEDENRNIKVTITESPDPSSTSAGDSEVQGANKRGGDATLRQPMIGTLPNRIDADEAATGMTSTPLDSSRKPIINPDLFESDEDDDGTDDATSEQSLIELVEQKILEKRARERRDVEQHIQQLARQKLTELQQPKQPSSASSPASSTPANSKISPQLTTGVGGSWTPPSSDDYAPDVEYYQPKSGSWGAFPRPKDISQAYGGGRRIGPGFSNEAERLQSEQDTRDRLQRYRERVGIDVKSEREHAGEIDEALRIANYAMQRGRYSTGVSALEKVTKYCSTNSKVGGKVFLELAMAYEAVGRTDEAILVYRTLSTSRIEDVKFNAKRLLYGIEAMQFMQNDVKSPEFSRRRARNTFIDTTGFGNIASHFDDVYQTAYVDLEGGFYKKLTESVVRSTREARQVLLRATEAGEVPRLRVVQALRSLSRSFDDALETEIKRDSAPEPVAVINGVPILAAAAATTSPTAGIENMATPASSSFSSTSERLSVSDEFVIMDPDTMMANLNGEWKLQLLADKRGDGVKYFNNAVAWQSINTANGTFSSCGPSAFSTVQNAGYVEFNDKRRILRRRGVQERGGGVGLLPSFFMGASIARGGFSSAVRSPQQVMSVDSAMLITRGIPSRRVRQNDDGEKDYFAVWRRVEEGTYSSSLAGSSRK
jgi:hypothetical protein